MYRQEQRYNKKDNQTARLHQANVVKEMNKANARTGEKLPAHFANSVFDEDTGQMLDYKKLINHNKKETREWWQRSSKNKFGKLMKGAGRNADDFTIER